MGEVVASSSSWEISHREGGVLAARWWKWALSAPDHRSPVGDTTGEHAGWRQPDDVWFLAGTYGGRVVRRCKVPSDRPLFFPVLNVQHSRFASWRHLALPVTSATASLNGMPLPLHEFVSPPFWLRLMPSLAWGVWGGVAPLPPGEYVLEIRGITTGEFWVDTTYHLTVANS
ncbi:hypothetical protein [Streptomyces sp. NPDC048623]|uniref:hypothetical protein n=1 Tax=Streptomyces sp. NPDC048623 TaxID=3155761 RepID=UPI003436E7F4